MPPTLAQIHGLVEPPPTRLTKEDWDKAEMNHEVRDAQRGLDETACAICMEKLSTAEQVILSCSHVYHTVCLNNFERFTKRKMDRCCPLCRCANYQKKKYSPALALLRKRSAIRIQTMFRQHQTKVQYQTVLQQHYSSGKGDRNRAHAFFAERVNKVSDRLVEAMNEKTAEVDDLVTESDRALELSRSIFASLDRNPRTYEMSQTRNGRSENSSIGNGNNGSGINNNDFEKGKMENFDWTAVRRVAEDRGLCDCPICMTSLKRSKKNNSSDSFVNNNQPQSPASRKQVALLSCSHVFHETCIEAFENFTQNGVNILPVVFTCPVCRAGYNRKRIQDIKLVSKNIETNVHKNEAVE